LVNNLAGDQGDPFHLSDVANPLQQAIGDAWRAAGAASHSPQPVTVDVDLEQRRGPRDNALKVFYRIELEPVNDAEAVAKRAGEQPGTGRRTDEREARQVEPQRAGAWTLADDDVECEILERREQNVRAPGDPAARRATVTRLPTPGARRKTAAQ
jgi:hypothetical protein